jgi:elongation factor P
VATTADFRNGMVIHFNGQLFKIVEFLHVKPGKGGAFVRTKLKNLISGQVIDNTFRAGERIEEIRIETREMEYLYNDGQHYVFMDRETYEQIPISPTVIGEKTKFLKENTVTKVLFNDEKPIDVEIPIFSNLKVVDTKPGVRGDTATGGTKPATLETGYVVTVPLFINQGDILKIDTRTGEYVERIK